MTIVDRIKLICSAKKMTVKAIEMKLGFANGTIGKWAKENRRAPLEKVIEVAKLLGTTPDYLLNGTEPKKAPAIDADLSDDERELLELFRTMNVLGRAKALDHLRDLNQLYSGDNGIASREAV